MFRNELTDETIEAHQVRVDFLQDLQRKRVGIIPDWATSESTTYSFFTDTQVIILRGAIPPIVNDLVFCTFRIKNL